MCEGGLTVLLILITTLPPQTPVSVAVSVCGPSTTVSSTVVSSSGQNTNHPPDPTPDSSSVVTRQEHVKKSQPEKKVHCMLSYS